MSGVEMVAPQSLIHDINVKGTSNVIKACQLLGCTRLIFCSSYNVVFDGQICDGGSEDDYDYCPPRTAILRAIIGERDAYSRTKAEAEKAVLGANGTHCGRDLGALRTCAVRPAAIYGEGEERHMPRIYQQVRRGIAFFAIGGNSTLSDWVYVENLAQALELADTALSNCKEGGKDTSASNVAGKPYFISDGYPINTFEFLRRIFVPLGYPYVFRFSVPTFLMLGLATLIEWFQFLIGNFLGIAPFLTTAEVKKVGVTHYFSIQKAREQLKYFPEIEQEEAIGRVVAFLRSGVDTKKAL